MCHLSVIQQTLAEYLLHAWPVLGAKDTDNTDRILYSHRADILVRE